MKAQAPFRLLNYERRIALPDQGWSLGGSLIIFVLLGLILMPSDRSDVWVLLSEPFPALLGGFLAARLILPDYEAKRLGFVLVRNGLIWIWGRRFILLMTLIFATVLVQTVVARVFPPEPWEESFCYLPLTGFVSALFFASSGSFVALLFRQSLAGELWTLFWGMANVLMVFPAREVHLTGLGPLFPFPVWFIHRRLVVYPQLHPLLHASERVPEHLWVLTLVSMGLIALHFWALHRLQQYGV